MQLSTRRLSFLIMLFGLLSFPSMSMAQIAPGVQQSAAQTATITGTVTQSDGAPVDNAVMTLTGPGAHLTTASDAHGTFVFTSVPYGTYRLEAAAPAFGMASRPNLLVRGDISVVIQYAAQNASNGLKEIARVSTQAAGASINVTPASIASVRPSDYAFQGNTSWQQLLSKIPGVTVGGGLVGGNAPGELIPGSPFEPIILSINGALPYETSVTLDGMPFQNVSWNTGGEPGLGADLSLLPMGIFDTADVVRGPGANTPSIVDSIGGSFVLHAPDVVDKNTLEFSISNDPYGGVSSNAKIALRLGRLSVVTEYGLYASPGPLGTNAREYAWGFPIATVNGQPFSFVVNSPTNSSHYQACYCTYSTSLLACCLPWSSAWTQHSGAIALSYAVTPSITAQFFYAGSTASDSEALQVYPVGFAPNSHYSGSLAPGSYNLMDAFGPYHLQQASSLLEEKITAIIGHGVLRLAALRNSSWVRSDIEDGGPNGEYTIYGTGYYASAPNTPVTFSGTPAAVTFGGYQFHSRFATNSRDLLGSYAIQIGTNSNAGISYVSSYYNAPYNESYCFGGVNYGTTYSLPSAVSETTNEARVHAGTEFSNKLSLDASWYFANGLYHVQNPSDLTGHTYLDLSFPYSAPRLSAIWRVNRNAVIRAAAGGGYALPPLSYLVGTDAPYCFSGECSVTVPNLHAKPEQSFGVDLGTDLRLQHNTALSFDFYQTNLYGQFFQSTTITTYLNQPLYTTQYSNLQHSRFEGINLDLRHQPAMGVYWHAALGLTRAYVISVPSGFYNGVIPYTTTPCTNCVNTYIVPGINYDGQFQSTVPYATATVQIGYRWSPEKYIDLAPTYYGNNNPYYVPAFVELDAHGAYPLTKNISLLATFRNITGIYDRDYELTVPTLGAPTVGGLPFPLFGIPYGPRSVVVTLNFKQ